MTLILTAVHRDFVLQVGDRLVSVQRGKSVTPYDAIANKTIVYRARDAIVTIGYAGLAYMDGQPTDQWLAAFLWGGPISPDGVRAAIRIGRAPRQTDIGRTVSALTEAIERASNYAMERVGLSLTIAGWQGLQGGHPRPFVVEIERIGGTTNLTRSPRYLKAMQIHGIGAHAQIADELPVTPGQRLGVAHLEARLVRTVRAAAANEPTIGADVLSVFLGHPRSGRMGCRFLPLIDHRARLESTVMQRTFQVAHSPWLVGPHGVYPPSMVIGQQVFDLGGLPFTIIGGPPGAGILGLSSSISRRPPPRR